MPVSREVDVEVPKRKAIAAGASEETVEIVFNHPLWPVRRELMQYPSSDKVY